MSLYLTPWHSRQYAVTTSVFEGPLDLLLYLIERAELDITKLALAEVTDHYLAHLRSLEEKTTEEVSGFLAIAVRLIQIKSEALLPRPPVREPGEEDPGESLARQLIIYKRFKEIAYYLQEREKAGLRTYLRVATPPKLKPRLDISSLTLEDLINSAYAIFSNIDQRIALGSVVSIPRITIREKISYITGYLRQYGNVSFRFLFKEKPDRLEIIVTFLAMLELIKQHMVIASQPTLFADIQIEPTGEMESLTDFELEFGE